MAKKITRKLTKKFWSCCSYYAHSAAASKISDHAGLLKIAKIASQAHSILEIGCGEGSKLAQITLKNCNGFGVDISERAIEIARKKYPRLNFVVGDVTKLPLGEDLFDLTYSAFVLEHLENPVKAISEQVRVTKKAGKLAFVAPNFGSPNRASPCFTGSRLKKLIVGLAKDLFYFLSSPKKINWQKVTPRFDESYQIDFDTQVEPYLLTLRMFLEQKKIKILEVNSFWQMELPQANLVQKIFRFLGEKLKMYPFFYWGPHLFLLGEKR